MPWLLGELHHNPSTSLAASDSAFTGSLVRWACAHLTEGEATANPGEPLRLHFNYRANCDLLEESRPFSSLDVAGKVYLTGVISGQVTLMVSLEWRPRLWQKIRPVAAVDAGGTWIWQQLTYPGEPYQQRARPVFRYRGRLGVELSLGSRFALGVWGHVGQVVLERDSGISSAISGGMEAGLILDL